LRQQLAQGFNDQWVIVDDEYFHQVTSRMAQARHSAEDADRTRATRPRKQA